MKEITRVHIASVPYEIELVAKQQLENYLKKLQQYNVDAEAVDDIEARMTELLAQQGVVQNNVITKQQIQQIIEQLGDPAEFMADDISTPDEPDTARRQRRLFRSSDHALLGGVLGGIAEYFAINPLWPRLVFLVLLFASFGSALIVYVVLWIGLPRVQTVADRLQLRGESVTAASIQSSIETEGLVTDTTAPTRLILRTVAAIVAACAAVGAAAVTVLGGFGLIAVGPAAIQGVEYWIFILISIAGGVLLTTLFGLIAYALATAKVSRQIVIAAAVVIALGIASLGGMVGVGFDLDRRQQEYITQNTVTRSIDIDGDLGKIERLNVEKSYGIYSLNYVVDSQSPRLEVTGLKQDIDSLTIPIMTIDKNNQLNVRASGTTKHFDYAPNLTVTIYGPALSSLQSTSARQVSYTNEEKQDKLNIKASQSSDIIVSGSIDQLTADLGGGSSFDARDAVINQIKQQISDSSQAQFGRVRSLEISSPEACRTGGESTVQVDSVADGSLTLNKRKLNIQAVDKIDNKCIQIETQTSL